MAQFSVVITDEEFELLVELAKESGRSNSSLAAEWIRKGIYEEIGNRNKVEVFRSMVAKRLKKKPDKEGE